MSVAVLWVFYLQWHQLPSWVSLLYLPPPCYPPSFYPILQRTSEGETEGNTNVNKQKIPSPPPSRWNQVKEKKTLLCFLCRLGTSYSSVYLAPMTTSTTKKEVDINSRNLQISTVVDTWNKLKPRVLYFPFCYPTSFVSLPWVLQKKHYLPYPNFLDVYSYSFFIYQILDAIFL